ncbi:MAG: terminase small subunit protein [Pseudomonadota bacterium]
MSKKKKYEHAGQPTKLTEKIATEICDRLSLGESLLAICKDSTMPGVSTVYGWLVRPENKQFLDMYTHARELQADTFMDQCIDIADDSANDIIILINKDGEEYQKINFEHINRSRLRVDTRIKIAEKMFPRKYTPRKALEHTGDIGVTAFTDEQLQKRLDFLTAKLSLPPVVKND